MGLTSFILGRLIHPDLPFWLNEMLCPQFSVRRRQVIGFGFLECFALCGGRLRRLAFWFVVAFVIFNRRLEADPDIMGSADWQEAVAEAQMWEDYYRAQDERRQA